MISWAQKFDNECTGMKGEKDADRVSEGGSAKGKNDYHWTLRKDCTNKKLGIIYKLGHIFYGKSGLKNLGSCKVFSCVPKIYFYQMSSRDLKTCDVIYERPFIRMSVFLRKLLKTCL